MCVCVCVFVCERSVVIVYFGLDVLFADTIIIFLKIIENPELKYATLIFRSRKCVIYYVENKYGCLLCISEMDIMKSVQQDGTHLIAV